jgi:hypothetical protein
VVFVQVQYGERSERGISRRPPLDVIPMFSYDKGTPVARPVRKAKDLNSETAWPSKREFGWSSRSPFTILE